MKMKIRKTKIKKTKKTNKHKDGNKTEVPPYLC